MGQRSTRAVQAGPQPSEQHILGCQAPETDLQRGDFEDFPGSPVVKHPTCNAGDVGSIPDQGTKIPHAAGQLSPCATITEAGVLQPLKLARSRAHALQQEKPAHCI